MCSQVFYIITLILTFISTLRCGEGYHPLLTTIRKELAAPGNGVVADFPEEIPEQPEFIPPPAVDQPQVPQDIPQTTTSSPLVDNSSGYKVVCYFTNWAWYRQGVGKYLPSDIDPNLCTHIVYGFAVLNGDQGIIKPHDDWADFDNSMIIIFSPKLYLINIIFRILRKGDRIQG